MGKPVKKDSFFIGKKRKNNFDQPSSSKQFTKKSRALDAQLTDSSSGSFFIKPSKKTLQTEVKKTDKIKKPFDKKKWRLQKYSKKYKLDQWEERRKQNLLGEYYKQVQDEPIYDVQKIYEKYADEEDNDNENNLNSVSSITNDDETVNHSQQFNTQEATPLKKIKLTKSAFTKKVKLSAQEAFNRKQEEMKQKKEELEKKKAEKEEAIKVYKQKKLEKFKKLNKKTKKGQPIMKYRMEMLLEQIQKSIE